MKVGGLVGGEFFGINRKARRALSAFFRRGNPEPGRARMRATLMGQGHNFTGRRRPVDWAPQYERLYQDYLRYQAHEKEEK